MRLALILAAAIALPAAAHAQSRDESGLDGGAYDDRGVDRYDRTPDWNYRASEAPARGAYYDGGRYGTSGIGGRGGGRLDPWLSVTTEGKSLVLARWDRDGDGRIGRRAAREANDWFRRYADTDRDRRLTDAEIRTALVTVGRAKR